MLGYGCDLSHHQNPQALPWESFRGHVDFVIVRAAYGVRLDERAKEHIQRARSIGAEVGLYLFFRHKQSIEDQITALLRASESCGIGTGDIVPAIDIEDDVDDALTAAWDDAAHELVDATVGQFGDAFIYISHHNWTMLGRPEWLLHRPLWVAHWRDVPATPGGMPATIHQHRVGPFEPNGAAGKFGSLAEQIDQNRLLLPLPLIGYQPTEDDKARVTALVAENLRRAVQDTEPPPPEEIA